MNTWIVSVVSIAGSAIVTTIVSAVVSRVINKQFKKKDALQAQLESQRTEERKKEINEAVENGLKPLEDSINKLDRKVGLISNGTLSTLRNDILTCYYRCLEKGYRNDYDTTNLLDLNKAYKDLDGNSFISDVVARFRALPTKEEFERAKEEKKAARKN